MADPKEDIDRAEVLRDWPVPMSRDEKKEWDRVKKEPATKEDWLDLHQTIEAYKLRRIARHREPEVLHHG